MKTAQIFINRWVNKYKTGPVYTVEYYKIGKSQRQWSKKLQNDLYSIVLFI